MECGWFLRKSLQKFRISQHMFIPDMKISISKYTGQAWRKANVGKSYSTLLSSITTISLPCLEFFSGYSGLLDLLSSTSGCRRCLRYQSCEAPPLTTTFYITIAVYPKRKKTWYLNKASAWTRSLVRAGMTQKEINCMGAKKKFRWF